MVGMRRNFTLEYGLRAVYLPQNYEKRVWVCCSIKRVRQSQGFLNQAIPAIGVPVGGDRPNTEGRSA
jgi:hypothetical protein